MVTITHFSPNDVTQYMAELINMLKQTVDHGASIGWLAPLSEEEARQYWEAVRTQVAQANKVLIVAQRSESIAGAVQLALESRANGNHRAEVQKLMVHTDYRRQGIARRLMEALDTAARHANRSLLVLDVRKDDPAEALYQKLGYIHVGDIPAYARSSNMELDASAFYYKQLA